jgi:hypothetical protein
MRSPSLKWRYPMIRHPVEGKGFFHGLHLLNAGFCVANLSFLVTTQPKK